MRQVAKKGLLTAMATGSVLASTAGYAHAAGAHGATANSPGVGSGNAVQAPVDLPVNACGNTINVIGLLNPAYGNDCSNQSAGGGSHAGSGSSASGSTTGSPGVGSGNNVQVPIAAPVNACGNSVDVVGLGNPAFGNDCGNVSTPKHPTTPPPHHTTPPPGDDCPPNHPGNHTPPPSTSGGGGDRTGGPSGDQPGTPATPGTPSTTPVSAVTTTQPRAAAPTGEQAQLASTGASGLEVLASTGALLLIGGGVLYRRARVLAGR
ncbi:chaplin family protein [Kitasatospora sp. NPDC049285]|uniref:chaplin n=1 Tax=Kitasatospora sp. NPDC049285 TaxID=3157096 RepID=UPI0034204A57